MRTSERELPYYAADLLQQQTGLPVKFKELNKPIGKRIIDGKLFIGTSSSFFVEVKDILRKNQLSQFLAQIQQISIDEDGAFRPWILITRYLSPQQQKILRENQLNYLDTAGNAFLQTENNYVLIEGKSKTRILEKETQFWTPALIKLVFGYLIKSDLLQFPYRQQKNMTGVGIATISERLPQLQKRGFIDRCDNWQWKSKSELAKEWIKAYPDILKPELEMGNYKFSDIRRYDNWKDIWKGNNDLQWGGEPAGELITGNLYPGEWTLYTRISKTEVIKQLRLIPTKHGPIKLFRTFWPEMLTANMPSEYVHPLLVYADLIASKDGRNAKIAATIYEKHLEGILY